MGERRFLETVWSYPVLWLMQVSWIFHGVSMQVSCWLHAGFADLAYWCVTSMTTPWNLHGICMEPPWNLHQSECMIKPTSVDRGTTSITHIGNCVKFYINSPWNLHGTSMKIASVRRRHVTITFRHKKQRLPTWNLHETYINSPWNLHGYSIKEDAIQWSGVDTGNKDFFLMETTWKPSDALIQIDRKSIVSKLIAQKLL